MTTGFFTCPLITISHIFTCHMFRDDNSDKRIYVSHFLYFDKVLGKNSLRIVGFGIDWRLTWEALSHCGLGHSWIGSPRKQGTQSVESKARNQCSSTASASIPV